MLTDLSFIDIFCRIALLPSQEFFFVSLLIIGFIFLRKEAFARAFFIFAFAMIFNRFLKGIFQVPLPPGVNPNSWAFPSGHMQTASTFWLWLAWEYKNKIFYIFTALLLACIGFALIHCGYHYPADIAGALFFALVTLMLYQLLIKNPFLYKNPPFIGFVLALVAIPFMIFTDKLTKHLFLWVAFGSLLGFSTGWLINNKFCSKVSNASFRIKLFILIVDIIGIVGIKLLFNLIPTKSFITEGVQFFIIALWLSSIPQCITCALFNKDQLHKKL